MPSTPFHIPPSTVVAFPFRRWLDLPTVLLANLTIDIEPAVAMLLDLGPPPHGYAHTLLGGAAVGALTGVVAWRGARLLARVTGRRYPLGVGAAVASGVLGCWFHVVLDAVMYGYLRPFWPLTANPVHIAGSGPVLHAAGAALLVPAIALLVHQRYWRTLPQQVTSALVALSAVAMAVVAAAGGV